jgi:hypothetical protein
LFALCQCRFDDLVGLCVFCQTCQMVQSAIHSIEGKPRNVVIFLFAFYVKILLLRGVHPQA